MQGKQDRCSALTGRLLVGPQDAPASSHPRYHPHGFLEAAVMWPECDSQGEPGLSLTQMSSAWCRTACANVECLRQNGAQVWCPLGMLDLHGRRRTPTSLHPRFVFPLIRFSLASLICSLAPQLVSLVASCSVPLKIWQNDCSAGSMFLFD